MTGIMTGVFQLVLHDLEDWYDLLWFSVLLADTHGNNWCLHTPSHRHTEGLVCWCYYTPFHWVLLCHVYRLFIYLCHTWTTLFIPVSYGFRLYISHIFFCLYQSYVILFILVFLFIKYTSAPVEVSVWLGGTTLKSVYGAFCVQDAVQVE